MIFAAIFFLSKSLALGKQQVNDPRFLTRKTSLKDTPFICPFVILYLQDLSGFKLFLRKNIKMKLHKCTFALGIHQPHVNSGALLHDGVAQYQAQSSGGGFEVVCSDTTIFILLTRRAVSDFSPLVFSNQEKMLEFIRNLRRSTSQQLRPSGNENIKINVTPPQGNLLQGIDSK